MVLQRHGVCVSKRNSARTPVPTSAKAQPQMGEGVDSVKCERSMTQANKQTSRVGSHDHVPNVHVHRSLDITRDTYSGELCTIQVDTIQTNARCYSWRVTAVAREIVIITCYYYLAC